MAQQEIPDCIKNFDVYPDSAAFQLKHAAIMLDISMATIWRMIARGDLETSRVGKRGRRTSVGAVRRLLSNAA